MFCPKLGTLVDSLYDERNAHADAITALAAHPSQSICVSGQPLLLLAFKSHLLWFHLLLVYGSFVCF